MTSTISYTPGKFLTLKANRKVHLGSIGRDILPDQTVEFDGTTLRVNGQEHILPDFRGAVRAEWLDLYNGKGSKTPANVTAALNTPVSKAVERPQPPSARKLNLDTVTDDEQVVGPAVRPQAKTATPNNTVSHEEREVGLVRNRKIVNGDNTVGVDHAPTATVDGEVALRTTLSPATPQVATKRVATATFKGTVQADDVGQQDAVVTGRIKTPAVKKTVLDSSTKAAAEVSRLDNTPPPRAEVKKVDTGRGFDRPEELNPEALKVRPAPMVMSSADESNVPERSLTGLLNEYEAGAVNPKQAPVTPPSESFQWDTTRHWRVRVQEAVHRHGNDPATLALIKASEKPEVVKHIDAALARRA